MSDKLIPFVSCIVKDTLDESGILSDMTNNKIKNIVRNCVTSQVGVGQFTKLANNSTLALIAKHFQPIIEQDDFSPAVLKKEMEDDFSQASVSYKEMVNLFGSNIAEAIKSLQKLHEVGSSLVDRYNTLYTKYQTNPPGINSYKDFSLTYDEWKDVSYMGPEDMVISELNNYLNSKNTSDITVTVSINYCSKLSNTIVQETKDFKSVIMSEEKKDAICNEISTSSGLSLKSTRMIFETLLSKNGMNGLISKMDGRKGLTIDFYNQITDLLSAIHKFQNGFDRKMKKNENKDLLLEDETIKYNFTFLNNIKKGLIYLKCYYRFVQWEKFLILPTGKVNGDLLDKAKASGIDKDTIRLFVSRTDFKQNSSFSIQNILEKKDLYLKLQNRDEEKAKQEIIQNEKNIKQAALQQIVCDYLKGQKIENYMTISGTFSKEAVNLNHPAEQAIYKAILTFGNVNNFTKKMYEKMGEELAKLSSQTEIIEKRNVQEVQASVVTNMITALILEQCN